MKKLIPRMLEVRQSYPPSKRLDFPALLEREFARAELRAIITPGMRIAVGVGSRGISNLKEIVKVTVDLLVAAGARPFVIPAMGSHGGATPEGQAHVLAEYGVTAESMGVPIETSMEVRKIGTALGGRDVVFSVPALEADGVVAINRVKPHTDFSGPIGSGIQKMLTIGFGKQIGANNAHRAAAYLGHETVIREFSKVILGAVPVLCGVAIVEDQRALMPRLPLEEIDLLIVDELGKEISGTGMDTNVIGREIMGYSASLRADAPRRAPHIARIFVRGLTRVTNGNAIGIGLADFTTTRLVKAIDLRATYVNSLTSIGLLAAKIPIQFESDREAIEQGLATLASSSPETLRVVRIANTLSLDRILVSESCAEILPEGNGLTIGGPAQEMQFDDAGNLLSF